MAKKIDNIQNQHLILIGNKIKRFLHIQGGYDNGYLTYIQGSVSNNVSSALDWGTPKSLDLTGRQINERGSKLNESIRKHIKKYGLPDLIIERNRREHGCYGVSIHFTPNKINIV